MRPRLRALLISTATLIATSFSAHAIEPEAAAQALADAIAGDGSAKLSFESAAAEGGNIVIKGFAAQEKGTEDTFRFEQAVIESPTEGDGFVFKSPGILFTNGTHSGETPATLASAQLTDVTVFDPAGVKSDAPAKGLLFATAEATDFRFKRDLGDITVARVFMEMGNVVDNVPQDSKGLVEDITVPSEAFAGAQLTPKTFGYDTIVLDITWDGSRNQAAKTATIRDFTVAIQDGGDLSLSGVMGNLPAPSAINDADAPSKASDVELQTLTIRFDDKSLTNRVLEYFASLQGMKREDYANGISATAGLLLGALNNPAFQGQVATALSTFLNDPQSLTIKVEPSAPIAGSEIANIARTAPQSLPERLNATVSANTAE